MLPGITPRRSATAMAIARIAHGAVMTLSVMPHVSRPVKSCPIVPPTDDGAQNRTQMMVPKIEHR